MVEVGLVEPCSRTTRPSLASLKKFSEFAAPIAARRAWRAALPAANVVRALGIRPALGIEVRNCQAPSPARRLGAAGDARARPRCDRRARARRCRAAEARRARWCGSNAAGRPGLVASRPQRATLQRVVQRTLGARPVGPGLADRELRAEVVAVLGRAAAGARSWAAPARARAQSWPTRRSRWPCGTARAPRAAASRAWRARSAGAATGRSAGAAEPWRGTRRPARALRRTGASPGSGRRTRGRRTRPCGRRRGAGALSAARARAPCPPAWATS